MTTNIAMNGSKWAGQEPDGVDKLLAMLAEHPLDKTFEAYGNFIYAPEPGETWAATPQTIRFWGNFHTYSHVFQIDTDEPELIETLTAAIRANQQRPDYLSQGSR